MNKLINGFNMSTEQKDNLQIAEYIIESSSDVEKTVSAISEGDYKHVVVHVYSVIHNTVLVQNLKQELTKRVRNVKLVLLKHKDRFKTRIVVYNYNDEVFEDNVESEVLNSVLLNKQGVEDELYDCKIQLMNRYFTDHLTRLPNLYQLRKDLTDNDQSGLVSIVIDDFGLINNYYGFMVGDFVIEQVAIFLSENVNDKIYRTSGTEFALMLDNKLDYYELKEYLLKLYKKIENISIIYQDTKITASITLASSVSDSSENIFSKVSMALKYAKINKLPFWIYEDNLNFENEYEQNLDISNRVRHAVQNSKIVPYYQAILDNRTGEVNKYECLARLMDENNNIIAPDLFIPITKRIKVYGLVTQIIINKSFETFKDTDYEFSINLSIDDVMNSEIFDFIIDKLKNSTCAKRVIFELVESEAIIDFDRVVKFITEVKRHGAKIAIDDFGDGYSNFSYLTKMDVDYLKIDGSLIKDIDINKNSYLVVETIVDFANKLGIKVIAEYVHSSTVMDKVKEMGIEFSQGFYIDKPTIDVKVDAN